MKIELKIQSTVEFYYGSHVSFTTNDSILLKDFEFEKTLDEHP
jgi:hypothetical protein